MESKFNVGDLVWARMKSYTPWPARIVEPEVQKKGHVYVYFFGSKPSYGWIPYSGVTAFDSSYKEELANASKKSDFVVALKQIEEYKQTIGISDDTDKEIEESESGIEETEKSFSSDSPKKERRSKRKQSIDTEESSSGSKKGKRKATEPSENGPKKSKNSTSSTMRSDENGMSSLAQLGNELLNMSSVLDRPDSPTVDLNRSSELLKSKDIEPSKLKFGFLGLGIMGSGIVKNLINSGHYVNLWSRNPEKCEAIKNQADQIHPGLVHTFIAPCDVMKNSDIVFSCSFDPECAKKNVFDNCGVIKQDLDTLEGKGYVEMTGIDPDTSQQIAQLIKDKNGRYLEAQIQGSRDEADEGSLVILTAGDKSLFVDCQSCFKAMGKTSLFLGDVGVATKVYLILQLMKGIALVGLAEGLVLADRCGISAKDIVNIFNMTSLSCPYLKNKAKIIIDKDFKKVEHSIQNMQKDIKLALGLSDQLMQPLMMASAANEVYKHSRKLGYDEHDCACIYMKARY